MQYAYTYYIDGKIVCEFLCKEYLYTYEYQMIIRIRHASRKCNKYQEQIFKARRNK